MVLLMVKKIWNTKKQESGFLGVMTTPLAISIIACMASSLIHPVASSLINDITREGQKGGFLPLLALPLTIKIIGKGVRRAYNNKKSMDIITRIKIVSSALSFKYKSQWQGNMLNFIIYWQKNDCVLWFFWN